MALLKCPECGNEVGDQAAKCPNCGYPLKNTTRGINIDSIVMIAKNKKLTVAVATGFIILLAAALLYQLFQPRNLLPHNISWDNSFEEIRSKDSSISLSYADGPTLSSDGGSYFCFGEIAASDFGYTEENAVGHTIYDFTLNGTLKAYNISFVESSFSEDGNSDLLALSSKIIDYYTKLCKSRPVLDERSSEESGRLNWKTKNGNVQIDYSDGLISIRVHNPELEED